MSGSVPRRPHSAEFFGAERDYWWNMDHLQLIAGRLGIASADAVLDVGCGVGHWGRLIGSVVSPMATIVGVDREPAWVRQATTIAAQQGIADRFRYEQGNAERLAFKEHSFDLVTCQTLLIHVDSPTAVIGEMLRVLRPGGLIVVAEPNNRASLLVDTSVSVDDPIEERVELLRFALTCEHGKAILGEGSNSAGDLIPGYLAQQGAEDVQTFLSDKTAALLAPYESEEQRVLGARVLREADEETWGWSREDARRYFNAGGGSDQQFERAWQRRIGENRRAAAALNAGVLSTAGGVMLYLISARKPAQPDGQPAR